MKAVQVFTTLQHPPLHAAARAYDGHHFYCPACICAGLGNGERCSDGAALWLTYQGEHDAATAPPVSPSHQRPSAHRAQAQRQEQFA